MCNEIERIPVKPNTDESIKELSIKLTDLESKYASLQENYDKAIHKQYHNDYLVENQKKIIENLHKTLERYETENKAMRALLQLWI